MSKLVTVPFDLKKAKAIQNGELEGKIVTRDGRSARIICWDAKNSDGLVVLVLYNNGKEAIMSCKLNGMLYSSDSSLDLMLQIPEYLTFKDGDIIAFGNDKDVLSVAIFREQTSKTGHGGYVCLTYYYKNVLTYNYRDYTYSNARFATEAERKILIESLQLSQDARAKQCLKKLGIVCEFKPFDKVLVRDGESECWSANFFSHKDINYYVCINCSRWNECIPYEGNERLLGTTFNID